mgnify:CR=1 FL=1
MPDRDEKGDDMADRMSRRFGNEGDTSKESTPDDQDATTSQSSESRNLSKGNKGSSTELDESRNVSDRPSVLMYLPEEQRRELDLRFDELNLKHKRETGDALQKNRDYYPAVIEAALTEKSLEAILLDDD